MVLKISSGDFDLITDAVDAVLERLSANECTVEQARTTLLGLIDLAAADDDAFMEAIKLAAR